MAATPSHSPNDLFPAALSTVLAFLATLFVLLSGAVLGTRTWILILRAASVFFLVSGISRILIAGWCAISSSIRAKELKTKGVS